jgi:hypothetical protein
MEQRCSNNIFKVCHISSNAVPAEGETTAAQNKHEDEDSIKVKTLYVYAGKTHIAIRNDDNDDGTTSKVVSLSELLILNPSHPVFRDIFSKSEIEAITHTPSINVVFLDEQLHLDDTIETIKKKIIYTTKDDLNLSFGEIYLFTKQVQYINTINAYKVLTSDGKLDITRPKLENFLLNIDNFYSNTNGVLDASKQSFVYSDIQSLKLDEIPRVINVPVGQEISAISTDYPYAVNPFDAIHRDDFLDKYATEVMNTLNKQVLLDMGLLVNNTLYMCTAEDVLRYVSTLADSTAANTAPAMMSESLALKTYFPFLIQGTMNGIIITTLDDLIKSRPKLIAMNEQFIDKRFMRNISNVNLLYDIYNERTAEINYIDEGIRGFDFIIHPENKFNLLLDVIFKLIHCSPDIPFIKYNPGKRQDNVFKLYADKISKTGRKIPILPKSDIFRLAKTIGRKKSVAVYIEYKYINETNPRHKANNTVVPIVCEFTNEGRVRVNATFRYTFTVDEVEEIIRATINPVINIVKSYIEQSGYTMGLFTSLYNRSIDILDINYFSQVSITKNIEIKEMIKCISSVFNEIEGSLKKGILLRYKRVSDYNEMDSQDAYIIEKLNTLNVDTDIIEGLMQNFMMTEEDAKMKIAGLLSTLQTTQNMRYRGGKIRIRNNPGYITKITKSQFASNITIEVNNINNILYLCTLPVYLDSIIRIYQDPTTTNVPAERIDLCRSSSLVQDDEVGDESESDEEVDIADKSGLLSSIVNTITNTFSTQNDKTMSDEEDEDDEADTRGSVIEIQPEFNKPLPTTAAFIGEELVINEEKTENVPGKSVNIFDLLFEDDDEDDDEDEEEEDGQPPTKVGDYEYSGGTKPLASDEGINDITGMRLSNPNPFFKRLSERDPTLFLTKDDGKHNVYSRSCPWNFRKQPVILTKEEKDKIDREHPGSYDQSIQYGSDPANPYWYICPRYWSLKHNTSLTEDEVKSGKYGEVIGDDDKVAKPGKNIFEFTDGKYHRDADGKYVKHYPGFQKKDAHPDGLCVPCCFSEWDKRGQRIRRQECMTTKYEPLAATSVSSNTAQVESDEVIPVKQAEIDAPVVSETTERILDPVSTSQKLVDNIVQMIKIKVNDIKDDRILAPEKFPLDNNRWGYLPVALQKFLFNDNKTCQISIKNTAIKKNVPCLMRRGVETSKGQSFISVIAYMYAEHTDMQRIKPTSNEVEIGSGVVPSIREMKNIIIKSLGLDLFVTLQNGLLTDTFYDDTIEVDISGYKNTATYKSMFDKEASKSKAKETTFSRICNAYEHFKQYIMADDIVIDHTYLWDIVTKPNPLLFDGGNNLIILHLPEDDITNNVEIICPTLGFSGEMFDSNKKTTIIMKKGDYYEPIYVFTSTDSRIEASCRFSLKSKYILPKVKHVIDTVRTIYSSYCRLHPSMPRKYKFDMNKPAKQVAKMLKDAGFFIMYQVLNFSGKTIGLFVEKSAATSSADVKREKIYAGVIPTAVSAPIMSNDSVADTSVTQSLATPSYEYPVKFMDNERLWNNTYNDEVAFLSFVHNEVKKVTKQEIACLPRAKVVEDGIIVGVLTQTNQFIQVNLSSPQMNVDDELPTITESNHIVSETEIASQNEKVDNERSEYIKNIRLETNFFNVFRNTARILINRFDNKALRDEIEELIRAPYIKYIHKLDRVVSILSKLMSKHIGFTNYTPEILNHIGQITGCITNDNASCDKKEYCMRETSGLCKLLIPKKNLINPSIDNSIVYFGKLADEIIRYERIRLFIFEPMKYLSFGEVKYNLNESEIILLESLLTQEYFDNLVPALMNPYAKQTTFVMSQPKTTQPYDNRYNPGYVKAFEKISGPSSTAVDAVKGPGKRVFKLISPTEFSHVLGKCSPVLTKEVSQKLKSWFAYKSFEITFSDQSPECSFDIILTIMRLVHPDEAPEKYTVSYMKQVLYEEYSKLMGDVTTSKKIYSLLNAYGMKEYSYNINSKQITFEQLLFSEHYFMTTLDIWILATAFKLPIILLSVTSLVENGGSSLVLYTEPVRMNENDQIENTYYFIKTPGIKQGVVPQYSLIQSNGPAAAKSPSSPPPPPSVAIPLTYLLPTKLLTDIQSVVQNDDTLLSYQTYISSFKLSNVKKPIILKVVDKL